MNKLLKESTILVTGGAGMIGSAIVWALNQRGVDNIYVSDFLGEDERFKNLVPLRFADYLEGDDLLAHLDTLPPIDYIFHLGACSATTERDCRYLVHNNYEYTKTLAAWAIENDARMVYASSAATYGIEDVDMVDDESRLNKLRPANMYGYSKHLFDLFAKRQGWLGNLVGLKYYNVFGPNENHKGDMRSVVHKAFEQIQSTGKMKLFKSNHPDYGDGEQMRDFIYVKDVAEVTLALAEQKTANGLYNIGTGEANTWNRLGKAIFAALGQEANIEYVDMPEHLIGKYQNYTRADISKLEATGIPINFRRLEDSVADYVQGYLLKGAYMGDESPTLVNA